MIRLILSILTLSSPIIMLGQMFPSSDHYLLNTLTINPAFAGCHDALSATIAYRDQWIGFEDAPKNQILSVHTPIHSDKIGLGLLLENNSIGVFKKTTILGNYAYRIILPDGKLSLGLGFGLTENNIAWNKLKRADEGDEQLLDNSVAAISPEFSLGGYYYSRKYFIGFSMPMLLKSEFDTNSAKFKINKPLSGITYLLSGGYEFKLAPDIKLLPSMLLKYHHGSDTQVDYNAQLNFNDKIWMGIGYRNKNTILGMLQCQLNYQLRLAYSYNFENGTIGRYVSGSHEIVLNYVFRYSQKLVGPRQF
jgi:type IX secretion system PorP/SprF family membrane protein